MKLIKSGLVLLVAILLISPVMAEQPIMLKVDGVGHMRNAAVPAFSGVGTEPAMCFDLALLDLTTGKRIGRATDCMSEVVPNEHGGLVTVATTTFFVEGGSATVQTFVSVQPVTQPGRFIDRDGRNYTHMSGAVRDQSKVIASTGTLSGISGTSRISGLLDMGHFNQVEGDIVIFNCLFEVYLD